MARRRRGFTLVETILAMLLLVIVSIWAAQGLEPAQQMARTRRAMTNQQETPRRIVSEYSRTAGTLVLNTPVTTVYDSVQVVATRVANTQLSAVPRVKFVMSDQHKAAGTRPDTVTVDFHPLMTGGTNPNLGDRRP
ncbi:MAG: prepilin-type N-terminal cleavage/methylation domain-containing protein [Gemmatimonadaceae bacterium]|nr:prepilin-type N-terminal cleavage/methylation domain-containing protein [Gemmatimonadaceae bacterium]